MDVVKLSNVKSPHSAERGIWLGPSHEVRNRLAVVPSYFVRRIFVGCGGRKVCLCSAGPKSVQSLSLVFYCPKISRWLAGESVCVDSTATLIKAPTNAVVLPKNRSPISNSIDEVVLKIGLGELCFAGRIERQRVPAIRKQPVTCRNSLRSVRPTSTQPW